MSKEQEKLVDEAYNNFIKKTKGLNLFLEVNKDIVAVEGPVYNAHPKLLTQEEFINKCKTNTEFSEKWGLTIEERELSWEERLDLLKKLEIFQERVIDNAKSEMIHSLADSHSIPTKLITYGFPKIKDNEILYVFKENKTSDIIKGDRGYILNK
jgi:type II secretory pathway predicted ATPase ExeA